MSLLSNCSDVAFKWLSSVEIDSYGSNQHELHGAVAFKQIFGPQRTYLRGTLHYVTANQTTSFDTELTWYDAREYNPNRSEYRLYYTYPISQFKPQVDDLLIVSQDNTGAVVIIIVSDTQIKNAVLSGRSLFKDYTYANGSSYYGNQQAVSFLQNIL